MSSITVYQRGKPLGCFDPGRAECLGEIGTSEFEVREGGYGSWQVLFRLPGDRYVLTDRTWDEYEGWGRDGPAELIERDEAVAWCCRHNVQLPADLLKAAGLTDFTAGVPDPQYSMEQWQELGALFGIHDPADTATAHQVSAVPDPVETPKSLQRDENDRGHSAAPRPLPVVLSAPDLARALDVPIHPLESFLRRFRQDHPDCFILIENPRRGEPRYLYRTADVLPTMGPLLTNWQKPTAK